MNKMCLDIGIVTCGPNEALVISGVGYGNKPVHIVGGRAIVFPGLQRVQRLPLSTLTLVVESPRVYTARGVSISVKGVAQVRDMDGKVLDDRERRNRNYFE